MDSKRIAHNYLMSVTGGAFSSNDVEVLASAIDFSKTQEPKKFKVALLFICLNPKYWQFIKEAIEGAKKFLLPGHQVDFFLWSDIPDKSETAKFQEAADKMAKEVSMLPPDLQSREVEIINESINGGIASAQILDRNNVFPTEPLSWPMPTLMRYHLFLQEEERLKDYDYIFYCDIDMRFVNYVGDEILGPDLTAAQHPMYALKKALYPPYEPNKESTAYIPRPGMVINDGTQRFLPLYFAGGFQGGKSDKFIEAMKVMRENVDKDKDFKNYMAVWNDESHWNKYLFDHPPSTVLTPSYIYPDSLIKEYYEPIWGTSYVPKIVTLTKKFSLKKLSSAEQIELGKTQDIGKI